MADPRRPDDGAPDPAEDALDEALEDSFPASDPPALIQPHDPDGDDD